MQHIRWFKRYHFVLPLSILMLYSVFSLRQLSIVPPVHQDEPWIASVAYKLATEGVYGSDMFTGYYAMDQRYYNFMPVYAFMLAAVFKVFGVGLLQMRMLSMACGAAVLGLTFMIGRKVGGNRVGNTAMILLCMLRLTVADNQSGIPLIDIARVTRYDIAVPVFGLLAFWIYLTAEERSGSWISYLGSGILIGVAGLTHLYGAFWLPAIMLAMIMRDGRIVFRRAKIYLLLLGFTLVWAPWIVYVLTDWKDYSGQMRPVAQRFDIANPWFYGHNILNEVRRYRSLNLIGPTGHIAILRPGAWTAILGGPLALWLLPRDRTHHYPARFALAIVVIAQFGLFAALLQPKTYSYMIALWPLICIALAVAMVHLWSSRPALIRRLLLTVVVGAILVEGGVSLRNYDRLSLTITSYETFEDHLKSVIPPESRVLGLHNYWLGLRDTTYRTWALPFLFANPVYYDQERWSFYQAMEQIRPTVVLIDPEMKRYLTALGEREHPQHQWAVEIDQYFADHHAVLGHVVEDSTYGPMQIYYLTQPSEP